jgi:hypothetical protein
MTQVYRNIYKIGCRRSTMWLLYLQYIRLEIFITGHVELFATNIMKLFAVFLTIFASLAFTEACKSALILSLYLFLIIVFELFVLFLFSHLAWVVPNHTQFYTEHWYEILLYDVDILVFASTNKFRNVDEHYEVI